MTRFTIQLLVAAEVFYISDAARPRDKLESKKPKPQRPIKKETTASLQQTADRVGKRNFEGDTNKRRYDDRGKELRMVLKGNIKSNGKGAGVATEEPPSKPHTTNITPGFMASPQTGGSMAPPRTAAVNTPATPAARGVVQDPNTAASTNLRAAPPIPVAGGTVAAFQTPRAGVNVARRGPAPSKSVIGFHGAALARSTTTFSNPTGASPPFSANTIKGAAQLPSAKAIHSNAGVAPPQTPSSIVPPRLTGAQQIPAIARKFTANVGKPQPPPVEGVLMSAASAAPQIPANRRYFNVGVAPQRTPVVRGVVPPMSAAPQITATGMNSNVGAIPPQTPAVKGMTAPRSAAAAVPHTPTARGRFNVRGAPPQTPAFNDVQIPGPASETAPHNPELSRGAHRNASVEDVKVANAIPTTPARPRGIIRRRRRRPADAPQTPAAQHIDELWSELGLDSS